MLKKGQPDSTLRDSDREAQEVDFPTTEENSEEPPINGFRLKGSADSFKFDVEKEDDDAVEEVIQITRDWSINFDESLKDNVSTRSHRSPPPLNFDEDESEDSAARLERGKLEGGGPGSPIPESESDEVDELEDEGSPSRGFSMSQSSKGDTADVSQKLVNASTHTPNSKDPKVSGARRADNREQVVRDSNTPETTTDDEVVVSRPTLSRPQSPPEDGQENSDTVPSTSFYGTSTVRRRRYTGDGKRTMRPSVAANDIESVTDSNASIEEIDLTK